ncbi:HAD family hydrolase [candidate division KSB1 bacterium]|nr:HAD family hydrolase [candidate division KSB1 bacterium]
MKIERIKVILEKIKRVKIAVLGDFCLDAYWMLDSWGSEISLETGLRGEAVEKQKYSLGGASNIAANLAALNPASIQAIGVIGDDLFGNELVRQLIDLGVNTDGLIIQKENFNTVTYCKQIKDGVEQPRIDFGIFNRRTNATDKILLQTLRTALARTDVLIINQQVPGSITNDMFLDGINDLINEFPDKTVLVDSRHYSHCFKNVYLKVNEFEAARMNNVDIAVNDKLSLKDVHNYADQLFEKYHKPVFLTRGFRGIFVRDSNSSFEIPGIQLIKEIDSVGAGDTTVSALSCCLGAGVSPLEAAKFANFAAAVTVQKLYQTGTASAQEILEIAADPDYIYQSELAEDIRQVRYYNFSEIEICYELQSIALGKIQHIVFDHDGTISTLRQGWEAIMELVMIKAILDQQYENADETLYHRVRNRVREYIDKSTGIQTILQMEALVGIVKEFGIVPVENVLDKFAYKEIFNNALMEMVNKRRKKIERGELDVTDYTMKGAVIFLKQLREMGKTLYLASGTDENDVIAEAKILGYDFLFNGGIYGATGDVKKYSKKIVIEKILKENNLNGAELACFGDGPVEIRECRKKNGIAIGIASDEIRRHGINIDKRARLIKAGAHLIIPDFSQMNNLLEILF